MRLCPECAEAYDKWSDYRYTGPLPRWRQDSPDGRNADLYWQRSTEMLHKYKQERSELVDFQHALIKQICAEKHARREAA